jgi:hypothetical protein
MASSDEIVDELKRLARLLSAETAKLEAAARRAVDSEADYRIGFARAILGAEGTVAERDAHAAIATDELFRERRLYEELLRVQRQRISAIERAIDVTRSIGATLRSLDPPSEMSEMRR